MPEEEVRPLISFLFGGDDGAATAERIDRRIDNLPGLGGLGLVGKARASATGELGAEVRRNQHSSNAAAANAAMVLL
jgi:hypothetical protein